MSRDPLALGLMLFVPTLQLLIYGLAVNLDVRDIATVVCSLDGRPESRRFLDHFVHSSYFKIVRRVESEEALVEAVVAGKARVGITLPPNYTDHVLSGGKAKVQVLIDGSDSTVATQALNVATAIGLRESMTLVTESLGSTNRRPPIQARSRVLFNPDMRSPNFMIPGVVGVVLQIMLVLLTAFAIVREKEAGTLEQLMVTPVARLALMLGKLIPYAVVGVVQMTFALAAMRFVFAVPIAGSVLLLAAFTAVFLFSALSIGLCISALAANQIQALQLAFMLMLPSMLLSGFIFPQKSMPYPIYLIGQLVPTTYFIRILRGIVLRGAGFHQLWVNGLVLAAVGGALLFLSVVRFRKTIG